jgi:hypothetical protein
VAPGNHGERSRRCDCPRLLARWEQYYLENSGPQRLGRIVSQIVRQLRGIRLPAPFNSVQPHQPEEPAPRSSDARSAADASDTQTSSTDTT